MTLRLLGFLLLLSAFIAPASITSASTLPPALPPRATPAQASAVILITHDGLSPAAVTVPPGVVRWQNTITATVTLISTGGNRVFVPVAPNATGAPAATSRQAASSGFSVPIPPGGSAELTFTDPGTHTYTVTNLNGGSNTGTIIISAGLTPTATTSPAVTPQVTSAAVAGFVDPLGLPSTAAFQYGTAPGGPYPLSVPATPLTPTTAISVTGVLTPLLPDTRYYYQTVITTAAGTASGNEQSVLTLPAPPVLNVTPISPTNSITATITTTVSANVTAVRVYTTTTCTGTPITQTTPLSGTFIVTATVPANTLVSFAATATNASGDSACSPAIDYYADTIPPSAPTIWQFNTIQPYTTDRLNVHFTNAMDNHTAQQDMRYQVCLDQYEPACLSLGNFFTATVTGTINTARILTVTGLLPGTWYYVQMRAVDAAGNVGPATTPGSPFTFWRTMTYVGKQITAGFEHSCALRSSDLVLCWGSNLVGELVGYPDSYPPVPDPGPPGPHPYPRGALGGVVQVDAGGRQTCGVHFDGTAQCLGSDTYGQRGDGYNRWDQFFGYVGGDATPLTGITQLDAGGNHACATLVDGTARCWGYGIYGQLGTGATTSISIPVTVTVDGATPLSGIVQVAAGGYHSCALLVDGTVRCWGGNGFGQLGDGATVTRTLPVTVGGATPLTGVTRIAAGYQSMCALLADGTARCWGNNSDGQLGDGTSGGFSATPVVVGGATPLQNINDIDIGRNHACAVLHFQYSTVRCWGSNAEGQLGGGSLTTPVGGLDTMIHNVREVATGDYHTCALLTDGSVRCWGRNTWGQLGNTTNLGSWTDKVLMVQDFLD